MSLSVCLLLDRSAERAVRALWQRLEDDGVPTLATHTHGHHLPHLTVASVLGARLPDVRSALVDLPPLPATRLTFQGLGAFTRSRCWLLAAVPVELLEWQAAAVQRLQDAGLEVHRNYLPGAWLPHLTLAPRAPVDLLPTVARRVYEVLPLPATLTAAAVVDTATGEMHHEPRLVRAE